MNRKAGSVAIAAGCLMLAAAPAFAEEGPYVGASIAKTEFDSDEFTAEDIDLDDTSWKIAAGYRLAPHWALEANYIDFGKARAPSVPLGDPFGADAKAYSLYGVGIAPLGPVELFAKAGLARIDSQGFTGSVLFEDKATEFAYGAGMQLALGRLALKVEYEKFDTDVIGDLDIVSLGFSVRFGAE